MRVRCPKCITTYKHISSIEKTNLAINTYLERLNLKTVVSVRTNGYRNFKLKLGYKTSPKTNSVRVMIENPEKILSILELAKKEIEFDIDVMKKEVEKNNS